MSILVKELPAFFQPFFDLFSRRNYIGFLCDFCYTKPRDTERNNFQSLTPEKCAHRKDDYLHMTIKAVIFDMDGVIFDSEALVIETWQEVAKRHSFSNVEQVCHECLGTNAQATKEIFLKHYGRDFPYDEYKKEMSQLFHERAAGGKLRQKPGIKELLHFLKENGLKTAVASSTRESVVRQELSEGGLLKWYDKIICGDMVSRSKPAPDIFLKACEELEISPSMAFVIEDSYNGIRAAHEAGTHPIMVPDLAEPTAEMEALTVRILPSLLAVKEYLSKTLSL